MSVTPKDATAPTAANDQSKAAVNPLSRLLPSGSGRDLLILAAIWAASLWLVNPIGNFPLNDDWSFGTTVKNLLNTGGFRPVQWASMPLLTQTLWGALFCLPAGFSFNALRLSTLVLSLCSMLGTYLLVRQVHPSRLLAAVTALTVAFNPIFYALSCTFMTEVPFIAFMLVSAGLFLRNLQSGSDGYLAGGLACALAATLCRQVGLAVPMAFAVCLLWGRGLAARWVIRAVFPTAVCLGSLLAFQHWLKVTRRLPALYEMKNEALLATFRHPLHLGLNLVASSGSALLYLGCFSLPVMLLALPRSAAVWRTPRARLIAGSAGGLFVLCSAAALLLIGNPISKLSSIVAASGIGPFTLKDVYILRLPHVASLGTAFWLMTASVAVLGGGLLVATVVGVAMSYWPVPKPARLSPEQTAIAFFLLCAGVCVGPMLMIGGVDRYWLPALPFLLAALAAANSNQSPPTKRLLPTVLVLASLAVYAVLGTRDYFEWNRVRWTALNDLLATENVTPTDVDGGFEFNGLYLYDPAYKETANKSWWWVHRDTYLLAFAEMPGWVVMKEYNYCRWLPPCAGRIVVLKKKARP